MWQYIPYFSFSHRPKFNTGLSYAELHWRILESVLDRLTFVYLFLWKSEFTALLPFQSWKLLSNSKRYSFWSLHCFSSTYVDTEICKVLCCTPFWIISWMELSSAKTVFSDVAYWRISGVVAFHADWILPREQGGDQASNDWIYSTTFYHYLNLRQYSQTLLIWTRLFRPFLSRLWKAKR